MPTPLDRVADLLGAGTLLMLAAVFVPLERLFPLRRQRVLRAGVTDDLVYWVVNGALIHVGIVGLLVAGVATVGPWVPDAVRDGIGGLPLLAQVALALLVQDLGFYAVHRLFHAVPWLWRYHAVHHSIDELDWLAGVRVHPLDQVLTKGLSMAPLFLLGFGDPALALVASIYLWQSHLEHANLPVRLGPLRWLVAGPEFHHWHHAREVRDRNFAGQLPFIDLVFGTAWMPRDHLPQAYGTDEAVPRGYLAQLAWPFRARPRP